MKADPMPHSRDDVPPVTYGDLELIHDQLAEGKARMDRMQVAIDQNTEITSEIRDILAAGRMGLRVLGGLGTLAKWVASIATAAGALWGMYQWLKHGAPPPK